MFMKNLGKFVLSSFLALGIVSTDSFGMRPAPKRFHKTTNRIDLSRIKRVIRLEKNGITEVNNPVRLELKLKKNVDQNTLVVFDCDEVLLTDNGTKPLNDKIKDIVSGLQEKGIRVLVLTRFNELDVRIKQLKDNGFHFEESWKDLDKEEVEDEGCKIKINEDGFYIGYDGFKQGVVTSGGQSKGVMLMEFLKELKDRFCKEIPLSKIIFIDDCVQNVEDVVSAAKEEHPIYGIHYTEKLDQDQNLIKGADDFQEDFSLYMENNIDFIL